MQQSQRKVNTAKKCPKKECEARNICFIDHRNISPKHNSNRSGLHLSYSETKKLIENILFCLCKPGRQTPKVGMEVRVSINANKGKAGQETKTVNSFGSIDVTTLINKIKNLQNLY